MSVIDPNSPIVKAINNEAKQLNSSVLKKRPQLYLKFFREEAYLQDLLAGRFFCNTPKYYREFSGAGVGDVQEAISYSNKTNIAQKVDPNVMIGPLSVKELLKGASMPEAADMRDLEVSIKREGCEDGWLHCWFAVDEPKDPQSVAELLSNLSRVRAEFGCKFVSMQSAGLEILVERLRQKYGDILRVARVAYSDINFLNSIICKRREYAYQREFRLIFETCDANEVAPRVYQLEDVSDIFSVPNLLEWNDERGTTHARLTQNALLSPSGAFRAQPV